MIRETALSLQSIGIVLKPSDLVVAPREQESIPEIQQLLGEINGFLASLGLGPLFREDELVRDPASGMVLLRSPEKMTAVTYLENGKPKVLHVPTGEFFRRIALKTAELNEEEVTPLKQYIDLGNGHFMLNFAVKFGLSALGAEPTPDFIFSTIMREESKQKNPTLFFGRKEELEKRFAYEDKPDESLRVTFSQAIYDKLNGQIAEAEKHFEGKYARPHQSLIDDSNSNVEDVEFWSQNGNFFGVVTLHMKNKEKHSFVLNKGKLEENGEFLQASCFVVSTTIDGEPAFTLVSQNRINGDPAQSGDSSSNGGVSMEFPRGFDNNFFAKGKRFLLEDEGGLSSEMILKHITTQLVLKEDQKIGSAVAARLLIIELPAETDFALENKRAADPAAKVEDLVPSWMKLSDILELVKKGETFVDAHTLAMMAVWAARSDVLKLKQGVGEAAMVFEQYQDFLDGKDSLTLPRSQNSGELPGGFNFNSGAARMISSVSVTNDVDDGLGLIPGKRVVLDVNEIWQKISNSEFDIVTMASIFKWLVQYDLLDYQKPA